MIAVQAGGLAIFIAVAVLAGPAEVTTVERAEGALRYEASVARKTYAPGEAVEVTLRIRNAGSSPASVTFASGQRYDLIVRRPRGDEVWRWSHDKAFIQVVQTLTLRPGEARAFKEAWDQRDLQGRLVDPGVYEIVALFTVRTEGGRDGVTLPPLRITIGR